MRIHTLTAALVAAGLGTTLALAGPAVAAVPHTLVHRDGLSYQDCASGGPTSEDAALASKLSSSIHTDRMDGIDAGQVSCARVILTTLKSDGRPERAGLLSLMTAMAESTLHDYTESADHDSLGLYQQRPSQGWGSPSQVTDPAHSTRKFFSVVEADYPNNSWESGDPGAICQTVQVSAYGDEYDKQQGAAQTVLDALWTPPVVDGGGQVADLNGDGRADLVTMAGNGDLSDWEGTGDIAHPYVSSLRYSIGTGFNAFHVLLAGDLNADHKADLVTMTGNGDLYAWQGTGDIKHPFLASLKYAIGTGFNGFTRIALADLNADGKADLITMTSNGNLYAWQNTGDIKHPYLASLKYAIGTGFDAYTSLSAADLNADNKADLITMTSNGNLYDWQNTGDIKHPYLAAQKYAIGTGFNTYTRIRAAEINNDHHADLITMTSNGTLTDWQGTGDIKHPYTASLKHTIGTGFDTYAVLS